MSRCLEHSHQVALIKKCKAEGIFIVAIPNSGGRSRTAADGYILNEEGMAKGFPDLMVPYMRRGYGGLFIELKTEQGIVSPDQEKWIRRLREQGYMAVIAVGAPAAWDIIQQYMAIRL